MSLAQQYYGLRRNPICVGRGDIGRCRLTWRYDSQPTPLSRVYTIRLSYQLGEAPQIVVMSPRLVELAGERRLPHVYHQDPPRLCLYRPGTGEWTPYMRIDQTIIPWTALWLFYFEEWLTSSEWKGGGEHPPSSEPAPTDARGRAR